MIWHSARMLFSVAFVVAMLYAFVALEVGLVRWVMELFARESVGAWFLLAVVLVFNAFVSLIGYAVATERVTRPKRTPPTEEPTSRDVWKAYQEKLAEAARVDAEKRHGSSRIQ